MPTFENQISAPTASFWARLVLQEDLNFLITNRIPRRLVTRFAGWFTRIESPTLTRISIAVWSYFGGSLHLEESDTQQFASIQQCFTRRLKRGARPIAQSDDLLVSPCDAEIGAVGRVDGTTLLQAKGLTYTLRDLLQNESLAERHAGSEFVTLRLKSTMYHRFHAPCDCHIARVHYISGDTWNVNPIALKRIENLFCRNERVVIELDVSAENCVVTLVPVAAILVASIRIHAIPFPLNLQYRGANTIHCDTGAAKGDELGYFENGSTIVVLAAGGFRRCDSVREGATIRMGQPLFQQMHAVTPPFRDILPEPA